jgi:NAD+ kinase
MPGKKRALLFINQKKLEARALVAEMTAELARRNYEIVSFSFERKDERYNPDSFDISFSLGGDGTVLFAARTMAPAGIPVLPINLGTLGFIAAVHPADWLETFSRWETGTAVISRRLMLEVIVERQGNPLILSCLNDAVISASGIAKLIRLEVKTETAEGAHIALGRFRADGLIVATPTGSTGYSVAAGGPIIDPEMDAMIINPICPFTLSNRPIVVPSNERVITLVEENQRSAVLLTVDGQITESLKPGDRIVTRRASFAAHLIASDREVFYRALRTKLAWSGGTSHAGYEEGSDA